MSQNNTAIISNKKLTSHKLTHGMQVQIKHWLAEGLSYPVIRDLLVEDYGITLNNSTLSYYAHHYEKEIEEYTKKFAAEMEKIPLFHKAIRLRHYTWLFNHYKKQRQYILAKGILQDIREEIEPTQRGVNIKNIMGVNNSGNGKLTPADKDKQGQLLGRLGPYFQD